MSNFTDFYWAMRQFVPDNARLMACQFRGDPNSDIYGKWRARTLNDPQGVDDGANVYLCVSAMQRNARGEFRRRKENFAGGILLMIDDIGTGKGAKFPMELIKPLPPTALVETSPDNFQAMYFFDSFVTDMELFDALIRGFINRQFLGNDPGSAGVNRVFRPPAGVNGKPKYRDDDNRAWRVRLHDWEPKKRYPLRDIARAFDVELIQRRRPPQDAGIMTTAKGDRIRAFMRTRAALRGAGMIKREEPDYSGWIHVRCPWTEDHTDGADNGAAIRVPEFENDWFGAFRCHHGHCERKGWRELTDWFAQHDSEALQQVNEHALEFDDYEVPIS